MAELIELANGAKLIYEHRPGPIYAFQPVVMAGHVDKRHVRPGLAHFVEHMLFEGSEVWAPSECDKFFRSRGLSANASTSYYSTLIAKSSSSSLVLLPDELDEITRLILNNARTASFRSEQIEEERKRIISEIQMENYGRDALSHHSFMRQMLPGHPRGYRAIGNVEDAEATTREEIIQFHHDYYTPNRMAIFLTGPSLPDGYIDTLNYIFNQFPAGTELTTLPSVKMQAAESHHEPAEYSRSTCHIYLPLPHKISQPEAYNSALPTALLMIGELFHQITMVEKRAYSISSYFNQDPQSSYYTIGMPVRSRDESLELNGRFSEYLKSLANGDFSTEKFYDLRDQSVRAMRRQEVTTSYINNGIAHVYEALGSIVTLDDHIKAQQAAEPNDVVHMARALLSAPPAVQCIGDPNTFVTQSEIAKLFELPISPIRRDPPKPDTNPALES